jgi:hypothetical protein
MRRIIAVVGQAGTGKTTWLMRQAAELAPRFLSAEHDLVLAITRMHGSRRRLQMKLRECCPSVRCSVTTIDGFALSLLNRWRTSLGYARPIQPVDGDTAFSDTILGTEAGFVPILTASTGLLRSQTVKAVIRETFPLVMIDEFQDCHGPLLDFVKALSMCSAMIVAADDFQFLESGVVGCPAVEWVQAPEQGASTRCTQLTTCHRTSVKRILDAARCLRENIRAEGETIPVVCCPNHGPAAFKIIEALVYNARDWEGATALICPTHDPFLQQVLASCNSQLQNRNCRPISWFHESSAHEEQKQLRDSLGLASQNTVAKGWTAPTGDLAPVAAQVAARTLRFCRLRGFDDVPCKVVARHIDRVVHERRAYASHSPKRIVTTVHGAKNREFDNVIILWPYTVPSDGELKRRLLYNAITRSKKNCMLLVRGNRKRAQDDPVLSLLGPARDAFPQKPRGSGPPRGKQSRR